MTDTMLNIDNEQQLNQAISTNPGVLVYFSGPQCGVCQVMKPRIMEMMNRDFPRMALLYVDCEAKQALAGQYQVFSVPTVLTFWNGHAGWRKSRNFSLSELHEAIHRPYSLLYE
jgi:thioredoxin-like negative regulator of GroEL